MTQAIESNQDLVSEFVKRLRFLKPTIRPINPDWLNDRLPPLCELLEEIETETPPMPIIS